MKIDKITKAGPRYKILLDDGKTIYTYDEVILKNGLLYHKFINEKLLEKIYNDTNYYKSYNKAQTMIINRLRSEKEIREYFKKTQIDEKDVESIIDNLKKIGLIDDYKYAKAYTNDKINLSLDGPYKIKRHLEQCNIDKSYIDEVIQKIDQKKIEGHIDKVIEKKIKNNKKDTPYILKQKIITYLINLGYSRESINSRIDKFEIKSIDLTNQIDKIYSKLKKKYSGKELEYKLKSKLYTKGFTGSEIDEYIKNSSLI